VYSIFGTNIRNLLIAGGLDSLGKSYT